MIKKTPPTIGILVRRFPKLSETFIVGELQELIRQGARLRILSMQRPTETMVQPAARFLQPLVRYFDQVAASVRDAELAKLREQLQPPHAPLARSLLQNDVSLQQLGELIALTRRYRIRHIHAHYINGPATLADIVARACGGTFSVSAHAKDIYLTPADEIRARISRATFVTTCTEFNAAHLRAVAPDDTHRIKCIYHGIDSHRFRPGPKVSRETPLIVAIGRFRPKKGFDLLIDACAGLAQSGLAFQCRIVGYGEDANALEKRIAGHGLSPAVSLVAPMTQPQIIKLLQHASVFVMPCRVTSNGDRDGIPNALLEAMACGVPIVSTEVSGVPEVVNTECNGLLVPPEEPVALTSAIRRLLIDPGLAKRLGTAARASVLNRFNWQDNVRDLVSLLPCGPQTSARTTEERTTA